MITKAIVPVSGWGTRRLPITKVIEKSMLPVGNRPLVDYSVRELAEAGVKDIYLVISNAEPCQVKAFYGENAELNDYLAERGKTDRLALAKTVPEGVRMHFLPQDPTGRYGTAIPVAMAVEEFGIDEPVYVFMGDDFIWNPGGESAAASLFKASENGARSSILGVEIPKEDVELYGVFSVRKDGSLAGVVEKPKPADAPSNLINVSKYILTPDLLQEIVDYTHAHDFGPADQEYYITDPISDYIAKGGKIQVARTDGEYLDGGTVKGWLHANNVVLGNS